MKTQCYGAGMNTPAHLLVGLGAMGRPGHRAIIAAALVGAIIPDLSLYVMIFWEAIIKGTSPEIIFNQVYFSDFWMAVFAIDNSLILWGLGLASAYALRREWAVALCGAALLHILTDFPLHMEDARPHLWPLTSWKFISPISYWNPAHGGRWVGALEVTLCLLLTTYIWRRYRAWTLKGLVALLMLMELGSSGIWSVFF